MQKDEEVGKVAQATPVAICAFVKLNERLTKILTDPFWKEAKALELFLQAIVEHSAKVTQSRSAKKVEPHHL
jgi:hypothetical protein